MPNLHMRSGSPAPRLSLTSSVCLAASGAGSETLKHSVHAGRTQPERVELRRSGVARDIDALKLQATSQCFFGVDAQTCVVRGETRDEAAARKLRLYYCLYVTYE